MVEQRGWRERDQVGVEWLFSVEWGVGERGNRLEFSGCFRLTGGGWTERDLIGVEWLLLVECGGWREWEQVGVEWLLSVECVGWTERTWLGLNGCFRLSGGGGGLEREGTG